MAAALLKGHALTRKQFYFLVVPPLAVAVAIVIVLAGWLAGAAVWVLMGCTTVYIFFFEENRKTLNPFWEGLTMMILGLLAVAVVIPQTRYVKHPRESDPNFAGVIYGSSYEEALRDPDVQARNARVRAQYGSGPRRHPKQ